VHTVSRSRHAGDPCSPATPPPPPSGPFASSCQQPAQGRKSASQARGQPRAMEPETTSPNPRRDADGGPRSSGADARSKPLVGRWETPGVGTV